MKRSVKTNRSTLRLLICAAVGCLGLFLLLWGNPSNSSGNMRIILIQKAIDDTDFWTSVTQGGQMAAEEYGVELTVLGPETERDIGTQNRMITEAVREAPDAIVLSPSGYSSTLVYAQQVEEAGIPLILFDSTMEEEIGRSVVATDNYAAGYKMGEYIRTFVKEDSVIGIVGHTEGSSTATAREAGFRAGLGEDADKVAEIVFCESSIDQAVELTNGLMKKYPDMDIIVGLNEYSAVGAARAVQDQGREQEIRMAGFDSSVEEIQLLEAGIFEAIVVQKPLNMGYLAVETAVQVLQGEKVESSIDSGSELITRENMYTDENQKLLFPVED